MSDTPPCPKTGQFSWNELITNDTKASASFYGSLFGWTTEAFGPTPPDASMPPYQLFKSAANPMGVGGLMQALQPGIPPHWMPYVVVDNVDVSLARAAELGAKIRPPVMPIPNVGRIACIMDPQGAAIGLHELPKPTA